MEPKKNEYQQAHDLFFNTDLTQQHIAHILAINRKTLFGWIKHGNWKKIKYAAAHAPSVLVEQYYDQLAALNRHIAERTEQPWPTKEESEVIRRLTATIKQMNGGKRTVSECSQVLQSFADDLRRKDLPLTQKIFPHFVTYLENLTEKGQFFSFAQRRQQQDLDDKEYEQWLKEEAAKDAKLEAAIRVGMNKEQDKPAAKSSETDEQRGHNGVTTPTAINQEQSTEPATDKDSNTTPETGDVPPSSQKNENGVTPNTPDTAPGTTPPPLKEWWSQVRTQQYTAMLEKTHSICTDPNIRRHGNITIVRSPSPLWGTGKNLFLG